MTPPAAPDTAAALRRLRVLAAPQPVRWGRWGRLVRCPEDADTVDVEEAMLDLHLRRAAHRAALARLDQSLPPSLTDFLT